jgi:DNA-binding MarR family transcriptional regulator
LTAKGRRDLQRMMEGSEGIRAKILDALGAEQVKTLKKLLAGLTDAMAKLEEEFVVDR